MDNTTVKLNAELLKRVKKLLSTDSYSIQYTNVKQFANIAVLNLLEKELRKKRGKL